MNEIINQFRELLNNPLNSIFLICLICILEIVLSLDNAALLATMVKDLPEKTRNKALKYGILGAYIFRGLALLFAGVLVSVWWIKPIGGLYLIYLAYTFFKEKNNTNSNLSEENTDGMPNKSDNWIYKLTIGVFGTFWSTIIMVEFMDLTMSIDNIFAVVAFSNNIILICIGTFIGILAMRFVAQKFVKLMETYTFLETCAYVVIAILGLKLFSSLLVHYFPLQLHWIESESFDMIMSAITILTFALPIAYHKFIKTK